MSVSSLVLLRPPRERAPWTHVASEKRQHCRPVFASGPKVMLSVFPKSWEESGKGMEWKQETGGLDLPESEDVERIQA